MPFDCVCDGAYRGTDEFGRIVAVNSFNREITEDEAAVLFLLMFSLCYLSLLQVLLVALIDAKRINSTDDVFVG